MDIDVSGLAHLIAEIRILWINIGIPKWLLLLIVPLCLIIVKAPAILQALNERRRIDLENERRARATKDKIEKEKARRLKRRKP